MGCQHPGELCSASERKRGNGRQTRQGSADAVIASVSDSSLRHAAGSPGSQFPPAQIRGLPDVTGRGPLPGWHCPTQEDERKETVMTQLRLRTVLIGTGAVLALGTGGIAYAAAAGPISSGVNDSSSKTAHRQPAFYIQAD